MKMLEKLQKRLHEGKKDNKGFSLVELIIVIAIMAILVGIVGTQVIPYLNRSRVQRDVELLSAISTAAVSAYSTHAESFGNATFTTELFGSNTAGSDAEELNTYIKEFLSYSDLDGIKAAMSSADASNIAKINIKFDFSDNTVTVTAVDASGATLLQEVTSQL